MASGAGGPQGSGGASPLRPPIRTPVELDLEARELQRTLQRSTSPLLRFHLLIGFLRRTATLPSLWTNSYYRTLYPLFSASVRHEYVCWIDPAHWVAALDFLKVIRDHD